MRFHKNINPGCEKGAASVEFALLVPFLALLLFSIVEYGWLFKTRIELENALVLASAAVIQQRGYDSPKDIAVSAILKATNGAVDSTELDACIDVEVHSDPSRAEVRLSGLPYKPLTRYLPAGLLPSDISLVSVMVYP